jgi:hypothetical protein
MGKSFPLNRYLSTIAVINFFLSYKPVILENGIRLMVPPFVNEGETVLVRLEDITYISRVTTK